MIEVIGCIKICDGSSITVISRHYNKTLISSLSDTQTFDIIKLLKHQIDTLMLRFLLITYDGGLLWQ